MDASLVAMIFDDQSSPKDWMASRLAGESSPRRYTPCAMLLSESKRESQTSVDFMAVNGLYCKMPDGRTPSKHNLVDPDGQTRVWYTTVFEYSWFYTFLKQKDYARAEEILHAVQRYSMTEEGYMIERYHPHNPYYLPWSPNNSANGRLIQMLLDFCP